jgi:hypothetical protein
LSTIISMNQEMEYGWDVVQSQRLDVFARGMHKVSPVFYH